MTEARRHDLIALAILGLTATLLFFDVFVGSHNFYMRDLTRYYYPTKQILRDVVLGGEFPYWNRQFSAGQPIAANPEHEVFYPLTWLILLPDYFLGYRLHILAHIYIGLFGMYALLRSMRLRVASAFFGALSFGLGGLYMSYINLLPILFCAAWIPLTCLYVRKFMLEPRLRWFALASLFLGLQCLVGEPTTVMQTGFILGMYALYRGWYAARDHGYRWTYAIPEMLSRVVFVGLISACAFLVGAAQMLPAADHVGDSARSRVFDFELVSTWSMPWAKLAELIYPNILGYLSIDRVTWYWAGSLYPRMGSPFLFSIYCGLFVTALAVAALFVRPRGGRLVAIMALFSWVLALGSHTPLLRFLYDKGVATAVRYPEKFIFIAMFAVLVLAAKLFDRMLHAEDGGRIRDAAMGFVAATAVIAATVTLLGFTDLYSELFTDTWSASPGIRKRVVELSLRGWHVALGRSLVLLGILWLLPKVRRPLWLALVFTFVVADIAPINEQINPRQPARFFVEPPRLLNDLPADRDQYRIFHEADWYGSTEIAAKYFSTGPNVYWIIRAGLYPMTPVAHGLHMVIERDYDKTALIPTIDFVDAVWQLKGSGKSDWAETAMAMSNAWFRSEYKDFDVERKRVRNDLEKAEAVKFVKSGEWPRYYFADQLVTVSGKRDFVARLKEGGYSRKVAFAGIPSFVPARGVVHSWRETANTATLDVESHGKGYLVMSVTPHKYWSATIDGKPARLEVTNVGYQGMVVPPGRHRVEMRYQNTIVRRGLAVSLVSIAILGIAAIAPRRRRNREA